MHMSYTIHQLPQADRPRERLLKQGPQAVSSAELIAIILGSGMKGKSVLQLSQELIMHFGGLDKLADATIEEMCEIKGLGKVKAVQLKAAFTLGVKAARNNEELRVQIKHPKQVYHLLKEQLAEEKREIFIVIMQDIKGYLISYEMVSVGTLANVLVHPREIFYPAIRHKASSIVLAHNHPSGDPSPSKEDMQLTDDLIAAGRMMGIPVQDHVIIGKSGYISLREQGTIF